MRRYGPVAVNRRVRRSGPGTPACTPRPSGRTSPRLPPLGRRGPGHRHHRPHHERAGRARAQPRELRQALFGWAFNPAPATPNRRREIAAALDRSGRASLPLAELEDTATVRLALGACARNLTGKPAAGSTQRRKRSVFYNELGYAVEQRHLPSNPVDRIQWTTPAVAQTVDRRVVVSPAQARTLLAAVRGLSSRGQHLEAFTPACTTPPRLTPVMCGGGVRAGWAGHRCPAAHTHRRQPLGRAPSSRADPSRAARPDYSRPPMPKAADSRAAISAEGTLRTCRHRRRPSLRPPTSRGEASDLAPSWQAYSVSRALGSCAAMKRGPAN
jgi:hypothetical protein